VSLPSDRLKAALHCQKFMSTHLSLKPQISLWGAILLGLGAILGTGVFVSLAVAANIAGSQILAAIGIGAFVALCNGLSAAQLAAAHPVSGGTYAYGYRYLNPWAGFTAGWLFLLAKSASAATAALGVAKYAAWGWDGAIALIVVLVMTLVAALGVQKSNQVNLVIVGITLLALISFAVMGGVGGSYPFTLSEPGSKPGWSGLLEASALMFVAYTGYGRITTMTEEVQHPQRTIPIAVITTLSLTLLLYLAVAIGAIRVIGSATGFGALLSQNQPPLRVVAMQLSPQLGLLMQIGAVTAMLGVLLNLILGLSRVLMAMGRTGDMPKSFARLNQKQTTPTIAVWVMGLIVAGLVTIGDIKTTWSFSAFNVLAYYSLTNLAALRLPPEQRLYPRWVAVVGLISCATLAFWVEPQIWQMGLGLMATGLIWKAGMNYYYANRD
jgi:basic amino acid/polyamine antiporter, APA family